jgi:aspartyl-tRNA(Asn)/glutamyl-tRNA(Gln) amidotransferase subunit B
MLDLTYEAPKPKVIAGAKKDWELVIGLEVHAQVASKAKLFSGASTTFGAEPNSNVSFVDAAMPGMLPVINEFCVAQAVRTGLGLKAKINLWSAFDRKNYFYPDLPQGYQISQLYHPIVGEGEVLVDMGPGIARRVRIERIHIEQDAGKSIHDMDPAMSFVDLNRTGIALMEIVSRPDIRGPEEAAAYVGKLRQIMRYLGTCDGNMQSGNLRADVNVSICEPGAYEAYIATGDHSVLGTRCEIKNMNSMRFIQQAIEVEARRQIAIVEGGGTVTQETRLYDPDKGETRSMRSKEEAHDYRYFPDPDLLPLEIEQAWVDDIAASLPELPDAKKARFVTDYGMTEYDAGVLTADVESATFFEEVAAGRDGKAAANWVINELFGRLKKEDHDITESPVSPAQLGAILDLIAEGRHFRQDRQGPVRDRLYRRRRPGRDRRGPRHAPGHRHRRDRGRGGRDHRRQPRPGRKGAGQPQAGRLVRRSGDEGDRRQGQPAGGERDRQRRSWGFEVFSEPGSQAMRVVARRRTMPRRAIRVIVRRYRMPAARRPTPTWSQPKPLRKFQRRQPSPMQKS